MKRILTLLTCLLIWFSVNGQVISPFIAGQNAWMPKGYGGAVYNGELDNVWPLVKKSKVQMIRVGGLGIEFNLPTGDEYVKLIDSIRSIGAEPMVQVPNGRGKYTASQAAAIVEYVNITKQRNVKYWIIGNEPNLVITGRPPVVNAAGVAAYIKEWSSAMKAVDPTILIVGPECSFYDSNYYPALIGGAHDITGKDANGRYYIDVISFHHYPFSGTQTRSQVTANAQSLASTVDNLIGLMTQANALHNRTGGNELTWALTEFNVDYKNPAVNTVEGLGVHSFLNGQYWAEVFNVGMQKKVLSVLPWSIHEMGGNRTDMDLGYLDGKSSVAKPRSSYYHEMLIAENFRGTYLSATDNQSMVTAFGSVHNDTIAVMLINKSQTDNFNYTLQLSTTAINDASPLKINVSSNVNKQFQDKLFNQSTVVLLFDTQGNLIKKIVYSLQHAIDTLPPTYLNPGERVTLVNFFADRTVACVVQDQEPVVFTSNIYGDYTSLNWDFGEGAEPRTASGAGPFSVTYTTTGEKTVSLTAIATDATVVVNKPAFIKASSCVRSPYATTVIPGVLKAIQYDYGGEGAAYHDTEETNRGSLINPVVPRADEGVDTNTDTGNGNVGWTENGEWLRYTVKIEKSGVYRVVARLASQVDGGLIRLSVNNVDKTGVVPVPKTSSWTDYQDVKLGNIVLEAAENATVKIEIVKNAFNLDTFTFTEYELPRIVINRIYNATSTADGMSDAVELLITKDNTDIRGLTIKDFDTNLTLDNGGKYQFKDNALWSGLGKGTTIVLRKLASGIADYVQDTDTTDFKIDLLFENTDYMANIAASGNQFNLTNTDMVLLKVGSVSGADNAVHAFATNNGGGSVFYNAVTSHKLVSTIILNTGAFQYPLNPDKAITDFNGAKTGNSTDTNLNWGDGYGTNNIAYIYGLRGLPPPLPPPSIVVNRVYNGSNDADGRLDAVELLVIKDRLDIRNLIVKDFETSNTTDNGGKYRFNDNPLWQNLRSGTTIVLRKVAGPAGYVEDTNGSDFTIDLLMSNATYLTNLAPTLNFNITQYDMVLVKSGALTGVDGAIHAFATKGGGGPTSFFPIVNSYKLVSPDGTDAGAGSFHYPLNPTVKLADLNGTQAAISKSTALNWGHGFGANNIAYIQSLRNAATPVAPTIVVNRVYNGSNDGDGRLDAVELLVVQDHFNARNLIVKDFENNSATDNGGKYKLNDHPFWQDLRAGTTIVLRKLAGPAGYVQDTDPSDFTIDLLMENSTYITNLSGGAVFNITQYDMVIVKTGAATGVEGTIHAFATKGGSNSPFFQAFNSYTLISPDGTDAGGGSFHYPLNPTKNLADFEGIKGAISKSAEINWGYGFGQNNIDYIQGIRNAVIAQPANSVATASSVNKIELTWSDNSGNETGFEIVRSLDGITYSPLVSVPANNTSYTDSCLNYGSPYYYRVRAAEGTVNSEWSAAANATTNSLPVITLPDLKGECLVVAAAPTASDYCGGEIIATTTDSLTYSVQGSFSITWSFDYGNGNIITTIQAVIVSDITPPTAAVLADVIAECSATLTAPVTMDNCAGEITGTTTDPVTYTEQGAYMVTWSFDDGNGNISTAAQNVMVEDNTAPVAITQNISVTLLNGVATITASLINNGSIDGCGIQSLAIDKSSFDCSNIGDNTVTLTVTDNNGNVSNATAIVSVIGTIPDPVISVTKTDNTFTGLDDKTIAIGYGAQNVTLTASNSSSASYEWFPAIGLNGTSVANPVFTPTAAGSYTFNVTATNAFGCPATTSVSIAVIDVRSGNNNDKVFVCTKDGTKTLSVSDNAVETHLRNGGSLGNCPSTITAREVVTSFDVIATSRILAYPNPFVSKATVNFRTITDEAKVSLELYALCGFKVLNVYSGPAKALLEYSFDIDRANIPPGVYFFKLTGSKTSLNFKVVVSK